jgi:integral membrane protein
MDNQMENQMAAPNGLSGALARFRVMAIIMGCTSLALWFVDLPTKFWAKGVHEHLAFIGIVHGLLYPIYVIAAFFYCLKAGRNFLSTVIFILAGTLPVLSFLAEKNALAEFKRKYSSN